MTMHTIWTPSSSTRAKSMKPAAPRNRGVRLGLASFFQTRAAITGSASMSREVTARTMTDWNRFWVFCMIRSPFRYFTFKLNVMRIIP